MPALCLHPSPAQVLPRSCHTIKELLSTCPRPSTTAGALLCTSHLCVQGTAAGGRAGRRTQGWPALAPALSLPGIALTRDATRPFVLWFLLPGLLCWFSSPQTISKDWFAQGSVFLFSALLHSLSHSMQPHDLNTLHMLMILRFKFPARTLS